MLLLLWAYGCYFSCAVVLVAFVVLIVFVTIYCWLLCVVWITLLLDDGLVGLLCFNVFGCVWFVLLLFVLLCLFVLIWFGLLVFCLCFCWFKFTLCIRSVNGCWILRLLLLLGCCVILLFGLDVWFGYWLCCLAVGILKLFGSFVACFWLMGDAGWFLQLVYILLWWFGFILIVLLTCFFCFVYIIALMRLLMIVFLR